MVMARESEEYLVKKANGTGVIYNLLTYSKFWEVWEDTDVLLYDDGIICS